MEDAEINSAAELERRWVTAFGGTPANVHRQVMRLLNQTTVPRPATAVRLAELTGKPAGYFTEGLTERRQSRLTLLAGRLEEVVELAVANAATLQALQAAIGAHDMTLEELRGAVETRLGELESRVQALEQ